MSSSDPSEATINMQDIFMHEIDIVLTASLGASLGTVDGIEEGRWLLDGSKLGFAEGTEVEESTTPLRVTFINSTSRPLSFSSDVTASGLSFRKDTKLDATSSESILDIIVNDPSTVRVPSTSSWPVT